MRSEGAVAVAKGSIGQAVRNGKLRWLCKRKNVALGSHVEISGVNFGRYARIAHHAQISHSNIGLRTSIGRFAKINNAQIGKYCSISWDVTIGATQHPMTHPSTHAFWYRSQFGLCDNDVSPVVEVTKIGNDVWIGCNVVIMPGVAVGDGAIVGAGSIVTKDVEPYAVVAGSPAKKLKMRFSSDEVAKLKELQWWDWPDEKIREHYDFFSQPLTLESLCGVKGEGL